jgi:hypothetical protein
VVEAYGLIGHHIGAGQAFDISRTTPVDPTDAAIAGTSLTSPVRYGLAGAGLSALAMAIGDASEPPLGVEEVNSYEAMKLFGSDLASEEARGDGRAGLGAPTPIVSGACVRPSGCSSSNGESPDGESCRTVCDFSVNTARSVWGNAILNFLASARNATQLDIGSTYTTFLTPMAENDEPFLFGLDAAASALPVDGDGPTITWQLPAALATVNGVIDLEVAAVDSSGIASLAVEIVDSAVAVPADSDSSAAVYRGNGLDTSVLAEGTVTLRATAVDVFDNVRTADRAVTVDNNDMGASSGIVVKGPVNGARVAAYRYPGGVKGALLGELETATDGTFTNLFLAEGYSGMVLLEAGEQGDHRRSTGPPRRPPKVRWCGRPSRSRQPRRTTSR